MVQKQSDYDGTNLAIHSIRPGESLSRIAQAYGMPAWEPIWIYNTQIEKVLGNNPNLIHPGVQIIIPRSKAGYDLLLKRLGNLRTQLETDGERERNELDAAENRLRAKMVLFDLAGDLAKVVVSFGMQAARTARLAAVAKQAKGQAIIGARVSMNSQSSKLKDSYAAVRARLTGDALKSHQDLRSARKVLGDKVKSHMVDTSAQLIDHGVTRVTGKESNTASDLNRAKNITDAIFSLGKGASAVLNLSETLLDFAKPSELAQLYVTLTTGENLNQSRDKALAAIGASVRNGCMALDTKIETYRAECVTLYG